MAVNDPEWSYGGPILINSIGTSPDPEWSYGGTWIVHEYGQHVVDKVITTEVDGATIGGID